MKKVKVLIVEDEILTAEALRLDLEEIGFEVCAAESSGEKAIETAERARPDIVLMDVRLHGRISGFEAAKKIRSRFDIPIIFMSGYSEQEVREKVGQIDAGFRIVCKPVSHLEIKDAVDSLLKEKLAVECT